MGVDGVIYPNCDDVAAVIRSYSSQSRNSNHKCPINPFKARRAMFWHYSVR